MAVPKFASNIPIKMPEQRKDAKLDTDQSTELLKTSEMFDLAMQNGAESRTNLLGGESID